MAQIALRVTLGEFPRRKGSSLVVSPPVNCSQKRGKGTPVPLPALLLGLSMAVFGLLGAGMDSLFGDEVWLKNGHQITGKICEINRDQLILEVPEGKITLQRHQIDYVVRISADASMLAECRRRLQGGFPGSSLPYLRREFIRNPDSQEVIQLYRECLLAELELELQQDAAERALQLWNEVSTIPGSTPEVTALRPRVLQEQNRLLKMEKEILRAIETGEPVIALRGLEALTWRFPSEADSWIRVFEEQSLLAALQHLQNAEYPQLQKTLENLLERSPDSWQQCRTALALAWIHNQQNPLEDALTWVPHAPALHLALAEAASKSENPLQMTPHLERVTQLVGEEIQSTRIHQNFAEQARKELVGESTPPADLHAISGEWLSRFWQRFAFPGSPPEIPAIVEHGTLEDLDQVLGSSGGPVRLESVMEYGQFQGLVLHVVRGDPFLCQNQLPRELFRGLIDTILETPRCPPWLQEGLAARARGPIARARDRFVLATALKQSRLPEVSDLIQMNSIDHEIHRAACGAIVDQLLETTPRALIPWQLQQIRDLGLEAFLRSSSEVDTLHKLQQRWVGELVEQRG